MKSDRDHGRVWIAALVGTLLIWLLAQGPGADVAARAAGLLQTIPTPTPPKATDAPPTAEPTEPESTNDPTDEPPDPAVTATNTGTPTSTPTATATLEPGAPSPTATATLEPGAPQPTETPTLAPLPGTATSPPTGATPDAPTATGSAPAEGEATATPPPGQQAQTPAPDASPTQLKVPTADRAGTTPVPEGIGGPGGWNLYCLWVAAGLVLVAAGIGLLVWRRRSPGTQQ